MSADDKKIRVLVVEDSPLIAKILSRILNSAQDIEVVGIATDGEKAIALTESLKPNLITMDINLPKKNGYEATKEIMGYFPTPILVVSSTSYQNEANLTFNAIFYGALDMIEKGKLENESFETQFADELIEKVRLLSKVKVISHPIGRIEKIGLNFSLPGVDKKSNVQFPLLGIAASTGGPQALFALLRDLPSKLPCATLIVQHIVPEFSQGYAEWLSNGTGRDVALAKSGVQLEEDKIFMAPGNTHLTVSKDGILMLRHTLPYKGHRPSANIMFSSLAEHFPHQSIGVILSGMGNDGLEGLQAMSKFRAPVIAQDEQTCVIYGMPKSVVDAGIATSVLPIDRMAEEIKYQLNKIIKEKFT